MTLPCPTPFNLADYVLSAPDRDPEKIALAVLGPARAERWSYARLSRAVLGMAGALRAEGLVPGDRVLLRWAIRWIFRWPSSALWPPVWCRCRPQRG
jgi:acyl-coenzyme A synthetase/AMP-(fatty) acid ligase